MSADFSGYAGLVIHDLGRNTKAEWNQGARFPAASTVKLGVLVAAIASLGRGDAYRYDLMQLTEWSSNLAANRLVRILGRGSEERGSARVEAVLRRLGARRSTYTGAYRVGTSHRARSAEPPLVSQRVTTASDLSTLVATIHSAAVGDRNALSKTRLSVKEARLALGLLLGSTDKGDNIGLVRPFVPRKIPVARKEGWLKDARHTVAIVYARRGPVILTALTYRPGLALAEAQRIGRALTRAAGL